MDGFDENVWKIVEELGTNERHFNQLQHQYRAMASGWILAMFAGAQFVFTNWETLPLPGATILSFLGLAGAVGITQLWNLDIRVYHQLLESCFVEGLKLEKQYHWLPRIRTNMLSTQSSDVKGVLESVVWFYLVGNGVSLLVALAGLAVVANAQYELGITGTVLVFAAGILAIYLWEREIVRGTRSPLLEALTGDSSNSSKR